MVTVYASKVRIKRILGNEKLLHSIFSKWCGISSFVGNFLLFLTEKNKTVVVAGKNNSIVFGCRSFMQCSKKHLLKHLSRRDTRMNHLKHDRIHDPRCAHSFSTSFKSQHTKSISPIQRIWTTNTNAACTAKENQRNYTVCHRWHATSIGISIIVPFQNEFNLIFLIINLCSSVRCVIE